MRGIGLGFRGWRMCMSGRDKIIDNLSNLKYSKSHCPFCVTTRYKSKPSQIFQKDVTS
jgi:hypothetical protein